MMNLWLLRPVSGLPCNRADNPWYPWYDKCFGMVVRAESEKDARELANNEGADENSDHHAPWLDDEYSTCEMLLNEGDETVVMVDMHSA